MQGNIKGLAIKFPGMKLSPQVMMYYFIWIAMDCRKKEKEGGSPIRKFLF